MRLGFATKGEKWDERDGVARRSRRGEGQSRLALQIEFQTALFFRWKHQTPSTGDGASSRGFDARPYSRLETIPWVEFSDWERAFALAAKKLVKKMKIRSALMVMPAAAEPKIPFAPCLRTPKRATIPRDRPTTIRRSPARSMITGEVKRLPKANR